MNCCLMSETQLARKLKIKSGYRVLMLNAPAGFEEWLQPLPPGSVYELQASGKYDVALLFASIRADLEHQVPILLNHLKSGKVLWIAFPKKSAGIDSELGMNKGWESLNARGLQGISLISISEEWSAMRFKPLEDIHFTEGSARSGRQGVFSEFINLEDRTILFPDDLGRAFTEYPEARDKFIRLSFTNKKEYMVWILTAKSQDTRHDRIQKTLEKLRAGKKHPSEK